MGIQQIERDDVCRLVFDGRLTFDFARELEDGILDALRRHTRFEMDLSGVEDIDLCGLHLLRFLESAAGENLRTVADSPVVDQARRRLLASSRGSWLRGFREEGAWDSRQALAA